MATARKWFYLICNTIVICNCGDYAQKWITNLFNYLYYFIGSLYGLSSLEEVGSRRSFHNEL
jgi:hypothetical protein